LTSSSPPVVDSVNHDPLLGKLLRIDPRSESPYAIPADNPFPVPAREVFAYGLRNPWRFSFDRVTGDLAIGDVGQGGFEELDDARAPGLGVGANYGWRVYEGLHAYPGGLPAGPPFPVGFVFPVLEKTHGGDGFCAITGGYVVRDPALPELNGQYVYGDFCKPGLRAVTLTPGGATGDRSLNLFVDGLASFGEDGCGRVYAVSLNGPLYRLATTGTCAGPSIPFSSPAVSIDDATVNEGNVATFQVSLNSTSTSTVTVDYTTADGTAKAPGDYTSTSGTLSFAPGETSKTITVPVAGDTIDEPDETFVVHLSNAVNVSIADGEGTGTIADDDPAPSLSIDDATVNEGDSGSSPMTFTVSLAGQTERTVTVSYGTADGTATAPGDYTSTSGTLSFAPGETTKTISVAVAGDTIDEADETFAVNLTDAVDASIADGEGAGTITDNDEPLPPGEAPAISVANVRVREGDSDTTPATFKVSLSKPATQDVAVDYTTLDGTAIAPWDYLTTTGRLVVPPGATAATVTVPVRADTIWERRETFSLVLSNPSTGAAILDGRGRAAIVDDDLGGGATGWVWRAHAVRRSLALRGFPTVDTHRPELVHHRHTPTAYHHATGWCGSPC
jgi:Calx-beta domain/Glucose / Sorbosone dehydrogenase